MKELNLKIYGRVQDVSFRYHTREKAAELGLHGWVKNETDGTITIVAQGSKENLEQLLVWCTRGPDYERVKKLEPSWQRPTELYQSFEIRY